MSPKVWEATKWKLIVDTLSATRHIYDDELAVEVTLNNMANFIEMILTNGLP